MLTVRAPSASAPNICWVFRPSLTWLRGSPWGLEERTRTTWPSMGFSQAISKRSGDLDWAARRRAMQRSEARRRILAVYPVRVCVWHGILAFLPVLVLFKWLLRLAQSHHGVDLRRAARRKVTRQQRDRAEEQRRGRNRQRITRTHTHQQSRRHAHRGDC